MFQLALILVQAAPLAGLPQPVELTPAMVRLEPSAPVRSAVLDGIGTVPARRSFRFACLAGAASGEVVECIPIGGAYGPPATDPITFGQRRDAFVAKLRQSDDDKLEWAAYRLARLRQLVSTGPVPAGAVQDTRHILVTETLGGADRVAFDAAAANQLDRTDIQFATTPGADEMARSYPPSAIRSGATASVTATCRVQPDRRLFCKDGRVTASSVTLAESVQEAFVLAAYQTLWGFRVAERTKSGKPTAGGVVTLSIRFTLPS